MNCWEILGVKPWTDKKSIKVAYARILKQTRPDDDPQGFRKLHDAYKEALALIAKGDASETRKSVADNYLELAPPLVLAEPVGQVGMKTMNLLAPSHTDVGDVDKIRQIYLPPPAYPVITREDLLRTPEQDGVAENWGDDWDALFERVNALINDEDSANDVTSWAFLEHFPALQDIEFRAQVSDALFAIVSEANEISLQSGSLLLKPPVLNYFNQLFAWERNWLQKNQTYSDDQLNAVLLYIDSKKVKGRKKRKPIYPVELLYYPRIGAFLIDGLVVSVVFYFLSEALINLFLRGFVQEETLAVVRLGSILSYFWVVIPLMEATPWQASVGKKLMGLIVVNKQGMRISGYHSVFRAFITSFCLVNIQYVIWINFFSIAKKNILVQDLLSLSYVIRK